MADKLGKFGRYGAPQITRGRIAATPSHTLGTFVGRSFLQSMLSLACLQSLPSFASLFFLFWVIYPRYPPLKLSRGAVGLVGVIRPTFARPSWVLTVVGDTLGHPFVVPGLQERGREASELQPE